MGHTAWEVWMTFLRVRLKPVWTTHFVKLARWSTSLDCPSWCWSMTLYVNIGNGLCFVSAEVSILPSHRCSLKRRSDCFMSMATNNHVYLGMHPHLFWEPPWWMGRFWRQTGVFSTESQKVSTPPHWHTGLKFWMIIWMIIIGKSWLALVRGYLCGIYIVHPADIVVDTCQKKYLWAVQNLQESHEYFLELTEVPTWA